MENVDWDMLYVCIYRQSERRPMILGTGKTIREAKETAMDTIGRLWTERGTCATDSTNAILLIEPGIGVRLQNDGTDFIVLGMCDSKIHHFGREVGYEHIEFLREPKSPWMPLLIYIGIKNENKDVFKRTRGKPKRK